MMMSDLAIIAYRTHVMAMAEYYVDLWTWDDDSEENHRCMLMFTKIWDEIRKVDMQCSRVDGGGYVLSWLKHVPIYNTVFIEEGAMLALIEYYLTDGGCAMEEGVAFVPHEA